MDDLDAFFDGQAAGLCHTDYWGRLAAIWRASDAAGRADERWAGVWEQARLAPGSDLGLMTEAERSALDALPEEVPVRPRDGEPFAFDLADGDAAETVPRTRVVALFADGGRAPQVVVPAR